MKINMELDTEEELLLKDAFESGIAECFFAEIEDEVKNHYYENVQKLINRFGLDIKVDDVINELVELNNMPDDEFDEEFEINEEEED